jgi:hypothetical protein
MFQKPGCVKERRVEVKKKPKTTKYQPQMIVLRVDEILPASFNRYLLSTKACEEMPIKPKNLIIVKELRKMGNLLVFRLRDRLRIRST